MADGDAVGVYSKRTTSFSVAGLGLPKADAIPLYSPHPQVFM